MIPQLFVYALLSGHSPAGQQPPSAAIDSLALARKWTAWFYEGQLDSLVNAFAPDARAPDLRASLTRSLEQLSIRGGSEVKLIEERFIKRNGNTQYWRIAQFSNPSVGEPLVIRWPVNQQWQL